MKEIIVAAAAGLLLCGLATIIFRTWRIEQRARILLQVFIVCLGALVALYLLTPDDLFILPQFMIVPSPIAGLLFCCFLYVAGFFGGVLQIYNLADRGLSLRMLLDISASQAGAMTPGDITTAYADGKGLAWMYGKRLDGLIATGMVRRSYTSIEITPRGIRFARLFARLRAFAGLTEQEPR